MTDGELFFKASVSIQSDDTVVDEVVRQNKSDGLSWCSESILSAYCLNIRSSKPAEVNYRTADKQYQFGCVIIDLLSSVGYKF